MISLKNMKPVLCQGHNFILSAVLKVASYFFFQTRMLALKYVSLILSFFADLRKMKLELTSLLALYLLKGVMEKILYQAFQTACWLRIVQVFGFLHIFPIYNLQIISERKSTIYPFISGFVYKSWMLMI